MANNKLKQVVDYAKSKTLKCTDAILHLWHLNR